MPNNLFRIKDNFKQQWLFDYPLDFAATLPQCYIDDTFSIFSSKTNINISLNYMNSKQDIINFTVECEENDTFWDLHHFCQLD